MSYVVGLVSDDIIVVGTADSADAAVSAVDLYGATAVLVEIQLPVSEGLATIHALRAAYPAITIVVCSFHDDSRTRTAAMDAGADAYLVKPLSPRDLKTWLQPVPTSLPA